MTKQEFPAILYVKANMRIIKEQTTLAAVSELRTSLDAILRQLHDTCVILEKHNKPVAVMLEPKRYEEMEQALESASDILLAFEARQRESAVKDTGYVPLDEAQRRAL